MALLSDMKDKWQQLADKVAMLSVRERGIVCGLSIVVIAVIWLQFVYTPIEKVQKKQAQDANQLNIKETELADQMAALGTALEHNPNVALREEQSRLLERLKEVREEIEGRLDNLIAPEKMADVMRDVLSDYKGLTLVSAKNLPVEPIEIKATEDSRFASDVTKHAVVFAHGFEITLEGEYFQTLDFLTRMENMKGFYWQTLDYQVERYPDATITIRLSTLSLEEDWIGV